MKYCKNHNGEWENSEINDDDLSVIIVRHPGDFKPAEYPVSQISGIHWDNMSGGVHRRSGNYFLYGYIPYADAVSIGISCSGLHNHGDNEAKVCIVESHNQDGDYRKAYLKLSKDAGERPKNTAHYHRPTGGMPCTKAILELVKRNGIKGITRGEVRDHLLKDGYASVTIRNALRSLADEHRCVFTGSSCSKFQRLEPLSK